VPDISDIIFLLFFLFLLVPMVSRRLLATRRYRAIQKLERLRGSRVITLIHRQESVSLLGIPLRRFIDVEDSEQVLRAIRLTPDTVPIDLVAHTPGGLVLASEQIARAMHRHPARVTVLVPHYAMSGGTLLALAADEIVMDENAVLGPVDPQIGQWPAASIINVTEAKPLERINDETLMLADLARKAQSQIRDFVMSVLRDDFPEERAAVPDQRALER
jgi:ClpP class serine protease